MSSHTGTLAELFSRHLVLFLLLVSVAGSFFLIVGSSSPFPLIFFFSLMSF